MNFEKCEKDEESIDTKLLLENGLNKVIEKNLLDNAVDSIYKKSKELKENERIENEYGENELRENEFRKDKFRENEFRRDELRENELRTDELEENELRKNELEENECINISNESSKDDVLRHLTLKRKLEDNTLSHKNERDVKKAKQKEIKKDRILINPNNLFSEINSVIKKELKLINVRNIGIFYKDNTIQLKPFVLFKDYEEINIENKINKEIILFLSNSLENKVKFLDIYSSIVQFKGKFNDELINLPVINPIILEKMKRNSYKCEFNIDKELLNFVYVHLFQIHKSKYKFKVLEKKMEIEELYYYDIKEEKKKEKRKHKIPNILEGQSGHKEQKGKDGQEEQKENKLEENGKTDEWKKTNKDTEEKEKKEEKDEIDIIEKKEEKEMSDSSEESVESEESTESEESDVLIKIYEMEHTDQISAIKKKRRENREKEKEKKKLLDKDLTYVNDMKKLTEDSEYESEKMSNESETSTSASEIEDKNEILYKRKIIYSRDSNNNTIINVFKEVENENICVYYPNSMYNQCLNLCTYDGISTNTEGETQNEDYKIDYNLYTQKKNPKSFCVENNAANLNFLNNKKIKIKKRFIRDISIYDFCCEEKYKGSNLFLHISKKKKTKNWKIDYNIKYSDFIENHDIVRMYAIKEDGDNKKKHFGKLFELDEDFKVNISLHLDINKTIQHFRRRYVKENSMNYSDENKQKNIEEIENIDNNKKITNDLIFNNNNARYNNLRENSKMSGGKNRRTNKLHYILYNFEKNCECLINLLNHQKSGCMKFDFYFPKIIGDVNEEIRKHYDRKKVILLRKSNIKYIRLFNNEVKRIMILFYVPIDSRILDLACGHGQDMLKYNFVKNKIYIGLDISQKEIDLAKERNAQNEFKKLCSKNNFLFLQGDILNNKYYKKWKNKNVKFDIISINLALHYVIYNEKSSKKFFQIIHTFLETGGLFLATTISTTTLTNYMLNRGQVLVEGEETSVVFKNDLFSIKFDQENLLKIFKNQDTLEEYVTYIGMKNLKNDKTHDFFYNLIKNSLDNIIGIKYYFYLYDTIDAHEFVIPNNYIKEKLKELNMTELFNDTAIKFLHYITKVLSTIEKYGNIDYFSLINKTISAHIFQNIQMRIDKLQRAYKGYQIQFDVCSLYHVYVFKKDLDPCIIGTV